jgi:hypothetical protein
MGDPRVSRLLQQLEATRFRDLAGARVSATIPIGEQLLNEILATFKPPDAPVQEITVRPLAGNRLAVRVKVGKAFVPPITVHADIVRQPVLPDRPIAEFRINMPPGVMAFAGVAMSFLSRLPPGLHLEGERLFVDLAELARRYGVSEYLQYAERVELLTEDGRLIVRADLKV